MEIGGGPVQAAALPHTTPWVASRSSQAPFLNPLLASKTLAPSGRWAQGRQLPLAETGDTGPGELVACPVCLCSDAPSRVPLHEFQLSHP